MGGHTVPHLHSLLSLCQPYLIGRPRRRRPPLPRSPSLHHRVSARRGMSMSIVTRNRWTLICSIGFPLTPSHKFDCDVDFDPHESSSSCTSQSQNNSQIPRRLPKTLTYGILTVIFTLTRTSGAALSGIALTTELPKRRERTHKP